MILAIVVQSYKIYTWKPYKYFNLMIHDNGFVFNQKINCTNILVGKGKDGLVNYQELLHWLRLLLQIIGSKRSSLL